MEREGGGYQTIICKEQKGGDLTTWHSVLVLYLVIFVQKTNMAASECGTQTFHKQLNSSQSGPRREKNCARLPGD